MQLSIQDPVFGTLHSGRYYPLEYKGQVVFRSSELALVAFNWDELTDEQGNLNEEDVRASLTKTHDVYVRFQEQEPVLRHTVADRVYGGDWIPPEDTPREEFTFNQFLSTMRLHSILFHEHLIFSVVYDFGELFGGHLSHEYLNEDFTLAHP